MVLRDRWNVEVPELEDLDIVFKFTIFEETVIEKSTTYNETDKRRWISLNYCGEIGDAELTVTIRKSDSEDHVDPDNSPRNFTVIPGPWNMNMSDFQEWNDATDGCQAHEVCEAKLVLRDDWGNYVNHPGIFTTQDADF